MHKECPFFIDNANLEYQSHYIRTHKHIIQHRELMEDLDRNLIAPHVRMLPREGALDIGCGMGVTMEYLMKDGFSPVLGIDSNKEQVDFCKQRGLEVTCMSNLEVNYNSLKQEFIVITMLDLLEHLPKQHAVQLVTESYRLLKPGGLLICTVPNAVSVLAGISRYGDLTHYNSFTGQSLEFLLQCGGFTKIKIFEAALQQKPSFRLSSLQRWWAWFNYKLVQGLRRWQAVSVLGPEGKKIPLSFNLLGVAEKVL